MSASLATRHLVLLGADDAAVEGARCPASELRSGHPARLHRCLVLPQGHGQHPTAVGADEQIRATGPRHLADLVDRLLKAPFRLAHPFGWNLVPRDSRKHGHGLRYRLAGVSRVSRPLFATDAAQSPGSNAWAHPG